MQPTGLILDSTDHVIPTGQMNGILVILKMCRPYYPCLWWGFEASGTTSGYGYTIIFGESESEVYIGGYTIINSNKYQFITRLSDIDNYWLDPNLDWTYAIN